MVWRCLRNPMFSHFGRTATCDRRSDRQIERHDPSIYHLTICGIYRGSTIASHGKTFSDVPSRDFSLLYVTFGV